LNQNHRIIEWFGLEGTFKGHLVQPQCSEQEHLQIDQVAQLVKTWTKRCWCFWQAFKHGDHCAWSLLQIKISPSTCAMYCTYLGVISKSFCLLSHICSTTHCSPASVKHMLKFEHVLKSNLLLRICRSTCCYTNVFCWTDMMNSLTAMSQNICSQEN